MSAQETTIPGRVLGDLDSNGRFRPVSDVERERRILEMNQALDELDDIGTPEEQRESLEALMQALDEDRGSGRKLFS